MDITKGIIVKANAGRDKGGLFIIVDIIDNEYSLLADGRSRRLEKPKKKKSKHFDFYAHGDPEILESLTNGEKLTNARLRKALAKFNDMLS